MVIPARMETQVVKIAHLVKVEGNYQIGFAARPITSLIS
jgi:hypothetical protein